MPQDLPNTLKTVLYDRVSSPLFAAFFISILGSNAQAILVLFSDIPVFTKIHHLQYEIYKNWIDTACHLLVLPTISTLLIIYVYPWFANHVYRHTQNNRKNLIKIKVAIEDDTPLTNEQCRKIKQDMTDLDHKYSEYVATTTKRVEDIESRHFKSAAEAHESNKNTSEEYQSIIKNLNDKITSDNLKHNKNIESIKGAQLTLEAKKDSQIVKLSSTINSQKDKIESSRKNIAMVKRDTLKNLNELKKSRLPEATEVFKLINHTIATIENLREISPQTWGVRAVDQEDL